MCIYLDAKYVKTQFYTLYNIINLWLVFFYITVTVAVTITDLLCHHHHVKISHGEIL